MLKHCVGKRKGSVSAPCRNKAVITTDSFTPKWAMWPDKEQGLCKRHAEESILLHIKKASTIRIKLDKAGV